MGRMSCKPGIIDPLNDNFELGDIGDAWYFKGPFEHPWFFSTPKWKMVEDYSPRYVHFKTKSGAIYQFRLEVFHSKKSMLLTSTLGDTFWFFLPHPSIENTMKRARAAQKPYASKTSFSGYVCWGLYFEEQHDKLQENLKAENVNLTAEALENISKELLKREALYNEI